MGNCWREVVEGNLKDFFWINMCLGVGGFVAFGIFEVLGQALSEGLVPFIAGGFLGVAFLFLSLWAVISQARVFGNRAKVRLKPDSYRGGLCAGHNPPVGAHEWRKSIPYLFFSLISFAAVNLIGYVILSQSWWGQVLGGLVILEYVFPIAGVVAIAYWMNVYQWVLHRIETYL